MLLFSIADYSHPLVGGMLIGLSAVMLWWSIAKIAGISGIVASLWRKLTRFCLAIGVFVGLLGIALAGWSVIWFANHHGIIIALAVCHRGYWSVWERGWAQGVPVVMVSVAMRAFRRSLVATIVFMSGRVCDGVYRSSFVVVDLIETLSGHILCEKKLCY